MDANARRNTIAVILSVLSSTIALVALSSTVGGVDGHRRVRRRDSNASGLASDIAILAFLSIVRFPILITTELLTFAEARRLGGSVSVRRRRRSSRRGAGSSLR